MVVVQPPVAALSQNINQWLVRNGFPIRDFTLGYGATPAGDLGLAGAGTVTLDPSLAASLAGAGSRLGTRKGAKLNQIAAIQALMHEQLHQMRYGRDPSSYNGDLTPGTPSAYEEGADQAVTQDLLPIYLNKVFGGQAVPGFGGIPTGRFQESGGYSDLVNNVRQLSTFGSGSKKFSDYGARVWRRTFLHADDQTRQQMVQQATAARQAWGQRTGR